MKGTTGVVWGQQEMGQTSCEGISPHPLYTLGPGSISPPPSYLYNGENQRPLFTRTLGVHTTVHTWKEQRSLPRTRCTELSKYWVKPLWPLQSIHYGISFGSRQEPVSFLVPSPWKHGRKDSPLHGCWEEERHALHINSIAKVLARHSYKSEAIIVGYF